MIEVVYRRQLRYPLARILSQYFDLEHIEHVHPRSLGRARIVSQLQHLIVWELEWPSICGIFRFRNLIIQEFLAPDRIRVLFARGPLRGTEVDVLLSEIDQGTLVEERYRIALPNWRALRDPVHKIWVHRLDRVWDEDLSVGMCHGGWPEIPTRRNGDLADLGA